MNLTMQCQYIILLAFSLYLFCVYCDSINKYQCSSNFQTDNNSWHWRGTNIGGWLVLEPWITPSLFYQFLGADSKYGDDVSNHVAFDSYSFCKVLGPEEANIQLRRHWQSWVTEENIRDIALSGVDTIRVPVGDWMFIEYGPYIGCYEGSIDELNRLLDLANTYKLQVLLEIHAMKGAQNAFDNSGQAIIKWKSSSKFEHIQTAGWIGEFDVKSKETIIDESGIQHGLKVISKIIELYKGYNQIVGLGAINEPWYDTPIEPLKEFYWNVYEMVTKSTNWVSIFHDSFRLNSGLWTDFLKNCPNYGLDSHMYLAWSENADFATYKRSACNRIFDIQTLEKGGIPVIVGEWSLATDNCALWLQGFNDNIYGYPKKQCKMIECPAPYMGPEQPGTPLDRSKGPQGPFGSGGWSTPEFGLCPIDVPIDDVDENQAMLELARAQLQVFESSHGQFFWNFRTELEPRWSYLEAIKRGWLPSKWNSETIMSLNECIWEETTSFSSYSWMPIFIMLLLFVVFVVITFRYIHASKKLNYIAINSGMEAGISTEICMMPVENNTRSKETTSYQQSIV